MAKYLECKCGNVIEIIEDDLWRVKVRGQSSVVACGRMCPRTYNLVADQDEMYGVKLVQIFSPNSRVSHLGEQVAVPGG